MWTRRRSGDPFFSLGGLVLALLALALARVQSGLAPAATPTACAGPLPFTITLPETLQPPAAATPAASSTPAPVALRVLLRADDTPAAHALQIVSGGIVPLLLPRPCSLAPEQRAGPEPCVTLAPPGGRLCAAGVVGAGTFSTAASAPAFALEAAHVIITGADGAIWFDALQGYVRYDDPAHGLLLICPEVRLVQAVGPSAEQFVALCQNWGAEGWAVSGQATDGNGNAPDSLSLAIAGPDGSVREVSGTLASGAIQVRTTSHNSTP